MKKLANFIINKRYFLLAIFVVFIAYCAISFPKVKVEYSISSFLPQNTDTAQAVTIMEQEFITLGSAKITLKNVSKAQADELVNKFLAVNGVKSVSFDEENGFKNSCALINLTFTGDADDEVSVKAYDSVIELLEGYEYVVPTPLYTSMASILNSEMSIILIVAAIVILLVLLLTSKSFAEIIVFPIVFIVAALLNMGTNIWLGTISFVSSSVCVVLQLALAIDYSIILCHRFSEEKERNLNSKEAMKSALSKAIPEILSSALTTVSGMLALMFMQLRLGYDLGLVLAKSIVCSLVTVFLLMPTLLLLLSKAIDKTKHKSFVPKIDFLGKGVIKGRKVIAVTFLALFAVAAVLSQTVTYVFTESAVDTAKPTAQSAAKAETEAIFGYDNNLVILVERGDYEKENALIQKVMAEPLVKNAVGVSTIEIGGYNITSKLNYSEAASMVGLDESLAKLLYDYYLTYTQKGLVVLAQATTDSSLLVSATESDKVPIVDLLEFTVDFSSYVKIEDYITDKTALEKFEQIKVAFDDLKQLISKKYSRIVLTVAAPTESEETFALIDRLDVAVKEYYPDAVFGGESNSAYDLKKSFVSDNLIISLLTIVFVFLILALTFKSFGLPLILVLVIQGAIFINFSIPVIMGGNLYFFVFIVSAIQMGATIDYAILITNRFNYLKTIMPKKQAIIKTLSGAFPTVMTSGLILTVASLLIGGISTQPLIATLGTCLGRGTIISIILVLTVLPALLYILDKPIKYTSFSYLFKRKLPVDVYASNHAIALLNKKSKDKKCRIIRRKKHNR